MKELLTLENLSEAAIERYSRKIDVPRTDRSSYRRFSIKKGVLKSFTGKHLCQRLLFHKVAGLRPLKKRL